MSNGKFGVATVAAAAMLIPASAQATVTIGSNLSEEAASSMAAPTVRTFATFFWEPGLAAPGGVASPVNGTVVRWRIKAGMDSGPINFRVVRPLGSDLFAGAGTTELLDPVSEATTPFEPAPLPISIGDIVGINLTLNGHYWPAPALGQSHRWIPFLADSDPGRAPDAFKEKGILMNADIEPTSEFELKAKPLSDGKVRVTADLPNAGTLSAGAKGGKSAQAAARPFKRLKREVTGPGTVKFKLRPRKSLLRALEADGKVKRKIKLTFTPIFGSAHSEVDKVLLRD